VRFSAFADRNPHDGNDRSFASLCELLDPSLVDGRGQIRGDRYQRHVVRRLKRHILDPRRGNPLSRTAGFPRRVVVKAAENPAFVALSKQLLALVSPESAVPCATNATAMCCRSSPCSNAAFSTVAACRSTLGVVLKRYREAVDSAVEDQESGASASAPPRRRRRLNASAWFPQPRKLKSRNWNSTTWPSNWPILSGRPAPKAARSPRTVHHRKARSSGCLADQAALRPQARRAVGRACRYS